MPAHKLEGLGVHSAHLVADVLDGVVAAELYLHADNEVEVVPALVVGGAVGHVILGGRKAQGVLVAAAVHTLTGVVGRCGLAQSQLPFLVPDSAEQPVWLVQVLANIAAESRRALAIAQAKLQGQLHLALELVCQFPHAVAQVHTALLAGVELLQGVEVGLCPCPVTV